MPHWLCLVNVFRTIACFGLSRYELIFAVGKIDTQQALSVISGQVYRHSLLEKIENLLNVG